MCHSTTQCREKSIIGSYSTETGVTIALNQGQAINYLDMKMAQLKSLSYIVSDDSFQSWRDDVQRNIGWILTNLTEEVEALIPIVMHEAQAEARLAVQRQQTQGVTQ